MAAANGDVAPARMFVAVRASAPVAAMPPKNGATMLPIPRPTSSAFGSCFLPVMASAMTADSSDSMAPSMAMASAGENEIARLAQRHPAGAPGQHRQRRHLRDPGHLATVHDAVEARADGRDVKARPTARARIVVPTDTRTIATSGAGMAL